MDPDIIPPAVVAIVLILTTGGVAILRPLAKRAGDLMEAMAREKREPRRLPDDNTHRIVELMESLHARLDRLEERQDFTDSLLSAGREGKTFPRSRGQSPEQSV